MYIQVYIHTYIYTYIHTYINTYIHNTYMHTYIHAYIHTFIQMSKVRECIKHKTMSNDLQSPWRPFRKKQFCVLTIQRNIKCYCFGHWNIHEHRGQSAALQVSIDKNSSDNNLQDSWATVSVSKILGCQTSKQHVKYILQPHICLDNVAGSHTHDSETQVGDQTCYLTQSQYTDTKPTSPSTDPLMPAPGRMTTTELIFRSIAWDQEKNKDDWHCRINTETKVEKGRTYSKNEGQ